MRFRVTHKGGKTAVTNADTGELIGGVIAVNIERASPDDLAVLTIKLIDSNDNVEADIEVGSDELLASPDDALRLMEAGDVAHLRARTLTAKEARKLEGAFFCESQGPRDPDQAVIRVDSTDINSAEPTYREKIVDPKADEDEIFRISQEACQARLLQDPRTPLVVAGVGVAVVGLLFGVVVRLWL